MHIFLQRKSLHLYTLSATPQSQRNQENGEKTHIEKSLHFNWLENFCEKKLAIFRNIVQILQVLYKFVFIEDLRAKTMA